MRFDRVVIVDWSSAGKPTTGKDSIWIGVTDAQGTRAENIATRHAAETRLLSLIDEALATGSRLMLAADFAYAAPAELARRLTGRPAALGLWDWLAARVTDTPRNRTNYRDVAAEMNTHFDGGGPFWGNGLKSDIPGLPRTKPAQPQGMPEYRAAEIAGREGGLWPKTIWQLAGAGAVGAQSLTGIPMLARLRAARRGKVAVWPFEDVDAAPVVIAEAYLSLLSPEVKAAARAGMTPDEAQVRLHAEAFWALGQSTGLAPLFAPAADPETLRNEGWYLGAGKAAVLRAALPATQVPPRLRDDCFAMPQGVDWVPVDTALARLRAALSPVTGTETCKTAATQGRILAADCIARRSNPPRPNSAVDGYGFAHASTGAGVQRLPLVAGRAAAGQPFDGAVPAGHAIRVLTGAILPEGVDAVLLEEDCATDSASVTFDGPVKPRANTRDAGEDVREGAVALKRGHRLRAPDLALLSALGIGEVTVFRRLRVGVLSTGDEILPTPDRPAAPHQIYDANRPMLLALARDWGCEAVDLGHARDDIAKIRAKLNSAAARVDIVLTSGGASAGDEDHTSRLLRDEGSLTSWRIAMKPGRPLALAMWRGVPVIGLPGNPVAAMVCALIFARPALSLMGGGPWLEPQAIMVPAAFAKSKKPGRREYLRARLNTDGAAEVFASEGSGRISGLSWADGLIELPDGAADIAPGTPVRFLPYSGFGIS